MELVASTSARDIRASIAANEAAPFRSLVDGLL